MAFSSPLFFKELLAGRIRPWRSARYLEWVRGLPCCVRSCCAPPRSDPHHVVSVFKAKGGKTSDLWAIPLCRRCHDRYTVDRITANDELGNEFEHVAVTILQAVIDGVLVIRRESKRDRLECSSEP